MAWLLPHAFLALPRPSDAGRPRRRSPGQPRGRPEIAGTGEQLHVPVIARQATVAQPGHGIRPLHRGERPLDRRPNPRHRLVEGCSPRSERLVPPGLVEKARLHPGRPQPLPPRGIVIGLVRVDRSLVALDQRVADLAVVGRPACRGSKRWS